MARTETAAPDTGTPVCGHDRRGAEYRSRRSAGTRDFLLIHTVAGAGGFRHAGGRLQRAAGETALYRPGTPHDDRTAPRDGAWELLWAHVKPPASWARLLRGPEASRGLGVLDADPPTAAAAEAALRAMVAHTRTAHSFRV